jgi:hypothetical protein
LRPETDPLVTAVTYRLADLEAFELQMVEAKRFVLAGVPIGKTEGGNEMTTKL